MNRTALAALISPWALPLSYACVLAAYVRGDPFAAAPLLPGHLAMVLILAYAVTLLLALPLWLAITVRWAVPFTAAAMTGAVIGLAVAIVYRRAEAQLAFPAGFLEWAGGVGGLLCSLIFRAIAGRQSNPPFEPTARFGDG
jgi:hypothetical protein